MHLGQVFRVAAGPVHMREHVAACDATADGDAGDLVVAQVIELGIIDVRAVTEAEIGLVVAHHQRTFRAPAPVRAPDGDDRAGCGRKDRIADAPGVDAGVRLVALVAVDVVPAREQRGDRRAVAPARVPRHEPAHHVGPSRRRLRGGGVRGQRQQRCREQGNRKKVPFHSEIVVPVGRHAAGRALRNVGLRTSGSSRYGRRRPGRCRCRARSRRKCRIEGCRY